MLKIIAAVLGVVVVLAAVQHMPGGQIPLIGFGWILLGWVVYRAYPALRDDVQRLVGGRSFTLRRRVPKGGGF